MAQERALWQKKEKIAKDDDSERAKVKEKMGDIAIPMLIHQVRADASTLGC